MKHIQMNSSVWEEGDYFVAHCLDVELSSFGKTRSEALINLQEAFDYILKTFRYRKSFLNPEILTSYKS